MKLRSHEYSKFRILLLLNSVYLKSSQVQPEDGFLNEFLPNDERILWIFYILSNNVAFVIFFLYYVRVCGVLGSLKNVEVFWCYMSIMGFQLRLAFLIYFVIWKELKAVAFPKHRYILWVQVARKLFIAGSLLYFAYFSNLFRYTTNFWEKSLYGQSAFNKSNLELLIISDLAYVFFRYTLTHFMSLFGGRGKRETSGVK